VVKKGKEKNDNGTSGVGFFFLEGTKGRKGRHVSRKGKR
jgi:hypothetical protein